MQFIFQARGHPAVTSTHRTTLELTTESHMTRSGNCIVGVGSSASLGDLPPAVKAALINEDCKVHLTLRVGSHSFTIDGRGALDLTLSHPTDIVVRRSTYVSDRTLMISANRSAADVPRPLMRLLQDPAQRIIVELMTEC